MTTADPDLAAAEDRLHAAYRTAASSVIHHAKVIADARRHLAEVLRPDQPTRAGLPVPPLNDADYRELAAAARDVGIPENQRGTPLQTVQLLRRLPDSIAAVLIERLTADADAGRRCWEMGHEGNLEHMRGAWQAAVQAHRCWEHSHPEEVAVRGA